MRPRLITALLLVSSLAWAQDNSPPTNLEPIPDGAPTEEAEQSVPAPEITIRRRGEDGTIEEYRVGGMLYMVKVNPAKGASYYLVDSDGNGSLETRSNDLESGMAIPAWVLLRW
ncbi:MAG: DUF2782 domain-containing protein [Phycisphaerales bacterium]|nr:DUF2782 domain-containing protein [Phycisphaerales bacterium]